LLLVAIPWLLRLERTGQWDWRTPFDWPLLLFLVTAAVSVWAAYDRSAALAKFWMIVAAVCLFYAFLAFGLPGSRSQGENWAATPAWLLAGCGGIVSLYFLATHNWHDLPAKIAVLAGLGRGLQALLPELPGQGLNPNVAGGMLAMAAPFAATVTWASGHRRKWPAFILGLALLGVTLSGLLLTTSRGAWLALAAAAVLAGLWLLAGLFSADNPGRRRRLFVGLLLLGVLLILCTALLRPDLPGRLIAGLPALAGVENRLDIYRNSLILAQDYLFTGAGLAGYMMLYSTYALLIHVGYFGYAHNLFLDVTIEQGLFALLALLWLWATFGLALWRRAGAGIIQPWLAAAALSLLTIIVHGLVDDAIYGNQGLMLLFLPLAFALPFPQPAEAFNLASRGPLPLAALGLLLLIMAAIFWKPVASMAISNLAAVRQSRAELSRYNWPEWPIQDALRRELDLADVVAGYQSALALNPDNASANRRLGQIELSLGDYEAALEHLGQAHALSAWDNATRQLYGEALLLNGQVERGLSLLAGVNNAQNQLGARAYWYQASGAEGAADLLGEVAVE
jgi:O-antigen ligase